MQVGAKKDADISGSKKKSHWRIQRAIKLRCNKIASAISVLAAFVREAEGVPLFDVLRKSDTVIGKSIRKYILDETAKSRKRGQL